MTHGSLFSGIGGFDLASEWMGWENLFHCEWNEFGQKILKYYWPQAKSYGDITKTDFSIWRGRIDILTGGFPCQPFSLAGKRKGTEDERHLWPEMLRAIREIQPTWIVGENVPGLVNWDGGLVFEQVQIDLEAEGYEVTPFILPACGINAPHKRERIWFIAHSDGMRHRGGNHKSGTNQPEEWPVYINQERDRDGIRGETPGCGRTSTDTDSNGCDRSDIQHEINAGERGFDALGDTFEGNDNGITSDTKSQQSERFGLEQRETGQQEQGEPGGNSSRMGNIRIIADTSSEQQQWGKFDRSTQSKREIQADSGQFSRPIRTDWENFPTQSPICDGNDGIPTELDFISFSKWRAESVKAGGNAIVPGVAFQIFKAIKKYEELNKQDIQLFKAEI